MCIETCFYSELYACDIQNMQVNTFTLCLVHLQQHRETGWRRMVVILLFEDASISYSDDLIQAVQLQVSYVVIFHSESNLRELEELEDRLQHGNSELFVPLWKKPLLLSQLLVFEAYGACQPL